MGKPKSWEATCQDDVGRAKTGTGHDGRWIRTAVIGVVGAVYLAALYFDIGVDGGREAALFFAEVLLRSAGGGPR